MKPIRTLAVSLLAFGLLAWFLRHANLADVWVQMRSADHGMLAWSTLLFFPMMVVRAVRWQVLMRPIGPVRTWYAWRATLIGFAASNVLPARIGEVLRPYLLAKSERLDTASTFATVVVERLLDGLVVLALLALYLSGLTGPHPRTPLMATIAVSAALAAVGILVLLLVTALLSARPERVGRLVHRSERVLPARIALLLARLSERFSHGLGVARSPRLLMLSLLWTVGLWLTISAQTWMVSNAFGIDIAPGATFLLQALLVIGISVPTPGGVGGFHEAYRIGVTTFFGASNNAAVGAGLVLHAISFIPTTVIGGVLMLRDGLSVGRLRHMADDAEPVSDATTVAP